MTALDLNRDAARRRAHAAGRQLLEALATGLWAIGWCTAKLLWLVLACLGGVFWGVGWLARRAAWPACKWAAAAVLIGWSDAHERRSAGPR